MFMHYKQTLNTAQEIFSAMAGIPGLTVDDVHVALWQARHDIIPENPIQREVIIFAEGQFRSARVDSVVNSTIL